MTLKSRCLLKSTLLKTFGFLLMVYCFPQAAFAQSECGQNGVTCTPIQATPWQYLASIGARAIGNFYDSPETAYSAAVAYFKSQYCYADLTSLPALVPVQGALDTEISASVTLTTKFRAPGDPYCDQTPAEVDQVAITGYRHVSCPSGTQYRYSPNGSVCVSTLQACAVAPLTPITDPIAIEHEEGQYAGHPDLDHVTSATSAGAECIVQRATTAHSTPRITSGYRPAAYQRHLREVWDKWQLLKDDNTVMCSTVKADVRKHWLKHGMVRQPVVNSNHSSGNAVDIAGVDQATADLIAAQCNMQRPEPVNDKVHFQPR
jgi:hypothetical protein